MNIKKKIAKYIDVDADIVGITLLSKEEYLDLKSNIKISDIYWWLRSPGPFSSSASYVYYNEKVSYTDLSVSRAICSVRPALIYKSDNLLIGDTVCLFGHDWTVISNKYILCDESICRMQFMTNYKVSDVNINANIYDASDVKKYLDDWFEHNIKEVNDETD